VIALAQLSRASLGAEIPGLQHLRESGSQEQDASIVLFLHHPQEDNAGRIDLILAKQREGVADIGIELYWHGGTQRFEEAE
jgi:replicative DNA helicase